jgi:hypothetical protein
MNIEHRNQRNKAWGIEQDPGHPETIYRYKNSEKTTYKIGCAVRVDNLKGIYELIPSNRSKRTKFIQIDKSPYSFHQKEYDMAMKIPAREGSHRRLKAYLPNYQEGEALVMSKFQGTLKSYQNKKDLAKIIEVCEQIFRDLIAIHTAGFSHIPLFNDNILIISKNGQESYHLDKIGSASGIWTEHVMADLEGLGCLFTQLILNLSERPTPTALKRMKLGNYPAKLDQTIFSLRGSGDLLNQTYIKNLSDQEQLSKLIALENEIFCYFQANVNEFRSTIAKVNATWKACEKLDLILLKLASYT